MIGTTPESIARSELQRIEAERTYIDLRARERVSELANTLGRGRYIPKVGDVVMFWPRWLGVRGQASVEGRWGGPGRVALVEPSVDFRGQGLAEHTLAGTIVWIIHGTTLIRCHPVHVRKASSREESVGFDNGLPRVMPDTLDELL